MFGICGYVGIYTSAAILDLSCVTLLGSLDHMAVTNLVNWFTGEVVGCWVKEGLVVGSLQSDWSPFY